MVRICQFNVLTIFLLVKSVQVQEWVPRMVPIIRDNNNRGNPTVWSAIFLIRTFIVARTRFRVHQMNLRLVFYVKLRKFIRSKNVNKVNITASNHGCQGFSAFTPEARILVPKYS